MKKKRIRVREYYQMILTKVSFSPTLFEKELRKAIDQMTIHQLERFRQWCWRKYWDTYPDVLQTVFIA